MSLDRRFFLKSIGAFSALTALQSNNTVLAQTKDDSLFKFETEPYLQNFEKDNITICIVTSKKSFAWIEILNEDNSIKETIYQFEDGMRNANATLFKFNISHGKKNFRYKIVAKEIKKFEAYNIEYGETISTDIFQTNLPLTIDQQTHLLIMNDIHENINTYNDLYTASNLPRKDLVIVNGDAFHYVTKDSDIIQKLLKPISNVFASTIPFVMVRGNHETRGSFARDFKKYFEYPKQKFYHSILIGKLFIIILDGGEDKPDSHNVYGHTVDYDSYRLEQQVWLENVLKSAERKKANHTIVINHIPWFHSDDWHGTLHNRSCFHNLCQQYKVSAVISGHTHKYGFHPPDKEHNYCVIIGGGPKEGNRTLVEVSQIDKNLSISLIKDNGEIVNTFKHQVK